MFPNGCDAVGIFLVILGVLMLAVLISNRIDPR